MAVIELFKVNDHHYSGKYHVIAEGSTFPISFTIYDEDSVATQPETLTLKLRESKLGTIVNTRNEQNVFNTNNVTVAAGLVTWSVQKADMTVVNSSIGINEIEIHEAVFYWTWAAGLRSNSVQIDLYIYNLGLTTL